MSPPSPPTPPTLQQLLTRLALAKRLFLKPRPKRRRTQQTTTTKKKPTATPPTREYSLRKRPPPVTTPTTILTSWRDEDDSTDDDDYDPRIERAYLKRKKPAKRAKTENGNLSLIVKIKINMESEAGKAFLDTLGMYQDDNDDNDPIIADEGLGVIADGDVAREMSFPTSANTHMRDMCIGTIADNAVRYTLPQIIIIIITTRTIFGIFFYIWIKMQLSTNNPQDPPTQGLRPQYIRLRGRVYEPRFIIIIISIFSKFTTNYYYH
ncbi:hypothetical protein AtubIFM57258_002139 [Aspergillus tubingensis]|nr:hypothetical protein AtubIFM57258_002139 [Aspergillus tubingensis]